jgi:putative heme-binding domain-containing protein
VKDRYTINVFSPMIRFISFIFSLIALLVTPLHSAGLSWIWKSKEAGAKERVLFRRDFEVPANVVSAKTSSSCDNSHRLWINGQLVGKSNQWENVLQNDIKKFLKVGARNVIAVEATNDGGSAAFAFHLQMSLDDGKIMKVNSDDTWLCQSEAPTGWELPAFDSSAWSKAVILAKMGSKPWGDLISENSSTTQNISTTENASAPTMVQDMTDKFKVAPGFRLEKLYDIPNDQGSWVSITRAENGNFICSDQYGKIYYVKPPVAGQANQTAQVLPAKTTIGGAHGLLWFQGALYVAVNEKSTFPQGVYRLTDENKDGTFDEPVLLKAMQGSGEHGPHSFVASPDGKWIYFIAGNHTDLAQMDNSMPNTAWAEDQLLPRQSDPGGHARDRMAPGGWISRFTPDGKNWQLVSMGYRNAFDIGFNLEGDLFAYDADMEWDLGSPWYRPTRICHALQGSEYGWRNGSGKWPSYYEDSMSAAVDIGPGSPTGVVSGKGAKFPEKYQRAIFALDWTFATMYAIHLKPVGAGFVAEKEEFVAGEGLPLTDAIIGDDGNMYFLTGGRRTKSSMWRVIYTGKESTAAVQPLPVSEEAKIRRQLEEFTLSGDVKALPLVWEHLASNDRTMRYTARVALEKLPVASWSGKLATENDPWRVLHGVMALARLNLVEHRAACLDKLDKMEWAKLSKEQQLTWLRNVGLIFMRTGVPKPAETAKIFAKIDALFPSKDEDLNRELCRLLSYLQAPNIVARTLTQMDQAGPSPIPDWAELATRNGRYGATVKKLLEKFPPLQNTFYAYCLRQVKGPWQAGERERFFTWLGEAAKRSGGNSYVGYINATRADALANATEEERARYGKGAVTQQIDYFKDLPEVKGPGRTWTVAEIEKLAAGGLEGRDAKKGSDMFRASLCAACHVVGDQGGAAGPQLNALGGRFTAKDVAEAIIEPSKVISDQYAFDLIEKNDGSFVQGRVLDEKDGKLIVAANPFNLQEQTMIAKTDVKSSKRSPSSPMPGGLINRLNEEEMKDLLAFLLGKH